MLHDNKNNIGKRHTGATASTYIVLLGGCHGILTDVGLIEVRRWVWKTTSIAQQNEMIGARRVSQGMSARLENLG
jgi:hypothetical protein